MKDYEIVTAKLRKKPASDGKSGWKGRLIEAYYSERGEKSLGVHTNQSRRFFDMFRSTRNDRKG
jgi:CRISPR/Cas system CSM-associated protein Csm2 small subunit